MMLPWESLIYLAEILYVHSITTNLLSCPILIVFLLINDPRPCTNKYIKPNKNLKLYSHLGARLNAQIYNLVR